MPKGKAAVIDAAQPKVVVDHIKQHPGPVQVTHAVKVDVPGKHFPCSPKYLTAAEQLEFYPGTAVSVTNSLGTSRLGAPSIRGLESGSSANRTHWMTPTTKAFGLHACAVEPLAPRDVEEESGC